jgi:hypothetical protein
MPSQANRPKTKAIPHRRSEARAKRPHLSTGKGRFSISLAAKRHCHLRGRRPGERIKAQVAQLVEQRTENPRVGGSIPPLGTIINRLLVPGCYLCWRSGVGNGLGWCRTNDCQNILASARFARAEDGSPTVSLRTLSFLSDEVAH